MARQLILVAILLLGLLFSSLDASIVSTSLVTIAADFQDFLDAPWVILAYLLAYLGLAIGFAKLSDIYGRRDTLCAAWILFAGFSIGCATAENMHQLIVCRAFQGMGGSGLYSLAQIALFEVGPVDKPSLMGALIGLTLAISYVLGPLLGGIISTTASWRWIFWLNVPFGALLVVGLYFTWPTTFSVGSKPRGWDAFRRIDFIGNTLIIAACTLLIFALQEGGGYSFAWHSPVIILAFVVSGLSWLGFVAWELRLGQHGRRVIEPVLPLRLVTTRVYPACVLCTLCTGFIYLSILVILPERFQIVNSDSALLSGVHLLPMLGGTALGAFFAGAVSRQRNNTSLTLVGAHALQLVGVSLLATLRDITTGTKSQYGFQVILGLGLGLSLGAATIMAGVQSRRNELAVAHGVIAQGRVLGGSIGIAICTIIFNYTVNKQLSGKVDPDDLVRLHQSPLVAALLPENVQKLVKEAYASAFTGDIYVMIGAAVLGVAASAFTYEKRPPPMPSNATTKESLEAEASEVELAERGNHG